MSDTPLLTYPKCGKIQRQLILDTLLKMNGARMTSMGLKKILPFPVKESALKRVLTEMEKQGYIATLGAKYNSNGRAYEVLKNGYE